MQKDVALPRRNVLLQTIFKHLMYTTFSNLHINVSRMFLYIRVVNLNKKKEDFGVTVKLHFHTIHHFWLFSPSSEKGPHEYELIIWLKQRLDFLLLLSGAEVYLFTVQVFIIFREAC